MNDERKRPWKVDDWLWFLFLSAVSLVVVLVVYSGTKALVNESVAQ